MPRTIKRELIGRQGRGWTAEEAKQQYLFLILNGDGVRHKPSARIDDPYRMQFGRGFFFLTLTRRGPNHISNSHRRGTTMKQNLNGDGVSGKTPKSKFSRTSDLAARTRLRTLKQAAEESLARIDALIETVHTAESQELAGALEIAAKENRDYFAGKMGRVRERLEALGQQLNFGDCVSDDRQLLRLELIHLHVLLESCRPDRLASYGIYLDARQSGVLAESIEALVLDVVNMRARIK
jgi:hypothetical protein